MKRFIALLLCVPMIFLFGCDDGNTDNPNVSYVNVDEYTGIPRETKADWFETKPAEDVTGEKTTSSVQISKEDLPEGFPSLPEGTSNISMIKYTAAQSREGYRSDWIRVKFSTPKHSLVAFSTDLAAAGYKGGLKFVESSQAGYEYYPPRLYGAWQNGKHVISIVECENEIDGSYAVTLDIVECVTSFYPELGNYFPVFNGYTAIPGKYQEITSSGSLLTHEFDGAFHEKWQITYIRENAFVGVTRRQYEEYIKALESDGFTGEMFQYKLDGCSTYIYDGINSQDKVYVSMIFNENLSTVDVVFTNDGTNFGA
ncbi:MAG: hypothetical protein J6R20_00640 [Clostridia bacterium]|nr:hypothetical protein [Clostridia bacterium]